MSRALYYLRHRNPPQVFPVTKLLFFCSVPERLPFLPQAGIRPSRQANAAPFSDRLTPVSPLFSPTLAHFNTAPLPNLPLFDESCPNGDNRRVVPLSKWACGAAGSALPWHGRGHRFDPDQVHQLNQSFRSSLPPRLCRILVANSKITPRTGFVSSGVLLPCVSARCAVFSPCVIPAADSLLTFPRQAETAALWRWAGAQVPELLTSLRIE